MCTIANQFLINNICQSCGANEGWNGSKCVCSSGFFKINNVCRTCNINTNYNGVDCVCNLGFFGNRDNCASCHISCGFCNGPSSNQCTSCSDVTYTLRNGTCSRNGACPLGLYKNGQICSPCSSYCSACIDDNQC